MIDKKVLDIICCPKCQNDLGVKGDILICSKCKMEYKVKDNIPILLTEKI